MLALQDRPTPVPTGDADDDCATQIWRGSPIVGDGEGTPARASTSVAVAQDRRAPSEPPVRDTIVDPPPSPPSLWARFKAAAGRFADAIESAFFGTAPLSTKLPPVPPPARSPEQTLVSAGPLPDHEHGEAMLRDLLRASLPHQRAAIEVARKDLVLEWRTLETLSSTGLFALIILVVFNFAFDLGTLFLFPETAVARAGG